MHTTGSSEQPTCRGVTDPCDPIPCEYVTATYLWRAACQPHSPLDWIADSFPTAPLPHREISTFSTYTYAFTPLQASLRMRWEPATSHTTKVWILKILWRDRCVQLQFGFCLFVCKYSSYVTAGKMRKITRTQKMDIHHNRRSGKWLARTKRSPIKVTISLLHYPIFCLVYILWASGSFRIFFYI